MMFAGWRCFKQSFNEEGFLKVKTKKDKIFLKRARRFPGQGRRKRDGAFVPSQGAEEKRSSAPLAIFDALNRAGGGRAARAFAQADFSFRKASVFLFFRRFCFRSYGIRGLILGIFFLSPVLFSEGCAWPSPFPSPAQIDQASRAGVRPGTRGSASNERNRTRYGRGERDCDETDRCIDRCERIFSKRSERVECESFSISEVREFERISFFLSGKDENGVNVSAEEDYFGNINRIHEEDLEDFVRIFEPFSTWVSNIPSDDRKKAFRNWVAAQPYIAEVFRDQDDEDFRVFEAMFGSCGRGLVEEGYTEAVTPNRNNRATPIYLAEGKGNRELIQWACDVKERKSCTPPGPVAAACN